MGGTYQPTMTGILEVSDVHLVKLRWFEDEYGNGVRVGSCIGSPEGVIMGWRGDIRFQSEPPAIWQFNGQDGEFTGWIPVDAGALGPIVAQLEADVAALQGQVITLQGEVTTLQGQVATLSGDVTTIQGQIVTIQGDITTLQGDVSTLQGQVATLAGDVSTLQGDVSALQGDVSTLQGDVVVLNDQFENGRTVFEVADFSAGQPTGEVATGNVVLVDVARSQNLTWAFTRAGATSFAIGAVNGLRYVADATNTAFNSGTLTSSRLLLPLSTLYNAFTWLDASFTVTIEAYFDLLTFGANLSGVAAVGYGASGSPSNAGARMRGAARGLRGGVEVALGKIDGSESTNYTTTPGNTANQICSVLAPEGTCAALVTTRASLAAGWARYRAVPATPPGPASTATSMLDENSFLAIGMWTGSVAGTMVVQLRSLRIRCWR